MSEYRVMSHQAEIDHIVLSLRELRKEWRRVTQPQGVTYELPSQDILSRMIDELAAILFPRHFGPPALTEDTVDAFIYKTLDTIFEQLAEQIRRELRLAEDPASEAPIDVADAVASATVMSRSFCANIPKIRALLETDVQAAFRGDPAARNRDEVLICYPGIKAIMRHRIAHELYRLGVPLIARLISESAHSMTGIDIHPGASIGKSFFIDHGTGVVIGETALIGENVRIYQAVTLGAKRFSVDESGALVKVCRVTR
jgi:serine O-acetyltransferase